MNNLINLSVGQLSRVERALSHIDRASSDLHALLERDGEFDAKTVAECIRRAEGGLAKARLLIAPWGE